jgi:hydrophobe/amphiphile efflux-3 (HAE3) family protein
MLKQLGRLIDKHPWLVIGIILIVTIGFSTLLPSIEFKTDFSDFMPEDEIVQASSRISDYFGQNQQVILLYAEKEQTDSVINSKALKEQFFVQEKLTENKDVASVFGISSIVDQICQLEFGEPFKNCSDEQLKIVVEDILEENGVTSIKLFDRDDENEEYDYKRNPKFDIGWDIDEIDIKNCYLDFGDEKVTFDIEVYDLSAFESKLKSPIPFSNVVEWYVDFENDIKPDERLNISYRLAAHFEPKHPLWELGKGPLKNIKTLYNNLLEQELFFSFKKEVYLWIKPLDQTMYFPVPLESGEINFDLNENLIKVDVSREELGWYGVAPRFGAYELPAKLTNFKCGTRYYQMPLLKLPWLRTVANTSYLFEKFYQIRERPILGDIAGRLMKRFVNLTWEDFDLLFELNEGDIPFPEQISLKDIEYSWINADSVPNVGESDKLLFYKPYLFKDLQISAKGLLSKDYEEGKKPSSCILILSINNTGSFEGNLEITNEILTQIKDFDGEYYYVTFDATGESVISTQINDVTSEANMIIMPMIFVIIALILFISFRKVSYVALPLVALVISTVWLFGTMVLLGIAFSTIAVAIVPLIMGLGVDYSVHISHNYREELARGKTPSEALKISVMEIGTAMFLAMLTTVIAFLSFLSGSVPPIRDFGLLLAIGITYTFITAITFQAAVRYVLDRKKEHLKNRKKKKFRLNIFMGKIAKKILKHQKKVLALLFVVTIFAGFGATQIKTGFDFNSFLPSDTPSLELYEKIQEEFPFSSQDVEYVLLEGDLATREALVGIMQTHKNLEDDTYVAKNADGSVKATSIYTIIIQAVNYNDTLIEEFNLNDRSLIPNRDGDVKRLYDYLYESPDFGFQTSSCLHRTKTGRYDAATISIYVDMVSQDPKSGDIEDDLQILSAELNDDLEDYGNVDAVVTGPMVITDKITISLTESQFLSTFISLILAAVVLIIIYRRPTLGLITMIPVLISIIWILGTMYFIGYDLNILTVTVTALTIGIGVDYSIHATERFRLVADKTGNIPAAVCETISRTGGALLIAALTTCLGFAVLIFAPIPPQVQFGVITAITILFSFITSVLLLPLLLARWAKWTKKRKGYIISSKPPEDGYLDDEHEDGSCD